MVQLLQMAKESDQPLLSWRAPEFYYYEKNKNWVAIVIGSGAGVALLFWLFKVLDWSFIAVIVLGVFVLIQKADRKPETVAVNVTPSGITIGSRYYPFNAVKSFHLTDHGDYLSVDFPLKKFGLPGSALVADQNTDKLREVLGKYLPEEPSSREYINDRITRWFRF